MKMEIVYTCPATARAFICRNRITGEEFVRIGTEALPSRTEIMGILDDAGTYQPSRPWLPLPAAATLAEAVEKLAAWSNPPVSTDEQTAAIGQALDAFNTEFNKARAAGTRGEQLFLVLGDVTKNLFSMLASCEPEVVKQNLAAKDALWRAILFTPAPAVYYYRDRYEFLWALAHGHDNG